jgi:hypothetical protein
MFNHQNIPGMRKRKYFFFLLIPLLFGAAAGAVMLLWNALLPDLFHAGFITYWQALGLLVLCRILFGFGGFGRRRNGPPFGGPSPQVRAKWINMSDEERMKFREEWKRRCERRKE